MHSNLYAQTALEDSGTDPGGRFHREGPAATGFRWPGHFASTFKPFLQIARDLAQVFELLDLLHELDAGHELAPADRGRVSQER